MSLKNNAILIIILFTSPCLAQTFYDTTQETVLESLWESVPDGMDALELTEQNKPFGKCLDLNHASALELRNSGLFTELQTAAIIAHRKAYGPFLTWYELQTIEAFSPENIRTFQALVCLSLPTWRQAIQTEAFRQQIRLNSSYRPEISKGYLLKDGNGFQGSAIKYALRYDAAIGNALIFGIHLEKDAGEAGRLLFASGFAAFHFKKTIQQILIGDQILAFGQGLLLGSGMRISKSAMVMQIMHSNAGPKPYRSFNETGFVRGASTLIAFTSKLELNAYAGFRQLDAAILQDSQSNFSYGSTSSNGYYRTEKEIQKRHTLMQYVSGVYCRYRLNNFELGLGSLYCSNPVNKRKEQPILIPSDMRLKTGLNLKWQYRNLLGFGEIVGSKSEHISFLGGFLLSAGKSGDISILYRSYDSKNNGNMSNAFGEASLNQNERGLYTGFAFRLPFNLQFSFYTDLSKMNGINNHANGPSYTSEQFCELGRKTKRGFNWYMRYRYISRELNSTGTDNLKTISDQKMNIFRFHIEYPLGIFRLRNRVEWRQNSLSNNSPSQGMLIYQDIRFAIGKKTALSMRYTAFGAEDYYCRLYAFENDIPGTYNMPVFSGNGKRIYVLFQFRITKHLQIWFRFARSSYDDRNQIGSGPDQIVSNHVSDMNFQIQWKQ